MDWRSPLLAAWLAACSNSAGGARPSGTHEPPSGEVPALPAPASTHFAFVGATVVGQGVTDVTIHGSRIEDVGSAKPGVERVDLSGRYLVAAFIDSHVHLSYYPVAEQLLSHGVVAAVDLAAPLDAFSVGVQPLTLLSSGPMITAVAGYPTRTWGSDGYGLEVATAADAEAAVDSLVGAGAALLKTPFTAAPTLDDETVLALVTRAHERERKVVGHALGAEDARRAAKAGVDVLGHTPVEALDAETLAAFSNKAVISTLAAFGGGQAALENLRSLREAGAIVLYGTDLGNTRDAGIQLAEIELLRQAGLDGSAIIAAGTSAPAEYFGLSELGRIAPGQRAALLVLDRDPQLFPSALATPLQVYIDGQLQSRAVTEK